MAGKLIENLKITQLFESKSVTATGYLYNGAASGAGIDTKEFDQAVVIINAGVVTGTVDFDIIASATDDISAATAVTGAAFTQLTSANDQAQQVGALLTQDTARYLWLRSNKTLNTNAALFSAQIVLGRADTRPQSNSEAFDV